MKWYVNTKNQVTDKLLYYFTQVALYGELIPDIPVLIPEAFIFLNKINAPLLKSKM